MPQHFHKIKNFSEGRKLVKHLTPHLTHKSHLPNWNTVENSKRREYRTATIRTSTSLNGLMHATLIISHPGSRAATAVRLQKQLYILNSAGQKHIRKSNLKTRATHKLPNGEEDFLQYLRVHWACYCTLEAKCSVFCVFKKCCDWVLS